MGQPQRRPGVSSKTEDSTDHTPSTDNTSWPNQARGELVQSRITSLHDHGLLTHSVSSKHQNL